MLKNLSGSYRNRASSGTLTVARRESGLYDVAYDSGRVLSAKTARYVRSILRQGNWRKAAAR